MKKRKARTPRQIAKDFADLWFSRYIRARDGTSVLSGDPDNLNCGHVFTRGHTSTRWDEMNAFAQTAGENLMHEYDPYAFFQWFILHFGQDSMDELYAKHHETRKFGVDEIREIGEYYKAKYHCILTGEGCAGLYEPVDNLSSDFGVAREDWIFGDY